MQPTEINILGFNINNINMAESLAQIERFVAERVPHQVITANTLMLYSAQKDESLLAVFNAAGLVVPDSIGLLWAAGITGSSFKERVAGIDLLFRLAGLSEQKGYAIYLLGAKPGVTEQAAAKLKEKFPRLNIAGIDHGYFDKQTEPAVIAAVQRAKPDFLFVGLNVPFQEKWISRNLAALQVPVVIGVGGSFDVISGKIKRAPIVMQKIGLEWLWRVLLEPWRIKRIILLPVFIAMVCRQKWFGRSI